MAEAAITPRIMVVSSVRTNSAGSPQQENVQEISLLLLGRHASAGFQKHFPVVGEDNFKDVIEYACIHSLSHLGRRGSSFPHRRYHSVKGDRYRVGHTISEKEAFSFGYHEPHIDTVCAGIALTCERELERGTNTSEINQKLREASYIGEYQTAFVQRRVHGSGLDYYDIDVFPAGSLAPGVGRRNQPVNAEHPIMLYVYPPKDELLPVGCSFFVTEANTIYEFMAYAPLE